MYESGDAQKKETKDNDEYKGGRIAIEVAEKRDSETVYEDQFEESDCDESC